MHVAVPLLLWPGMHWQRSSTAACTLCVVPCALLQSAAVIAVQQAHQFQFHHVPQIAFAPFVAAS